MWLTVEREKTENADVRKTLGKLAALLASLQPDSQHAPEKADQPTISLPLLNPPGGQVKFSIVGKDASAEGLSRSLGLYNSTQEVDFEQLYDDAVAALAIEVHETDESFSHAFGTHRQFGWEASEEVGEVAVEFLTLANDLLLEEVPERVNGFRSFELAEDETIRLRFQGELSEVFVYRDAEVCGEKPGEVFHPWRVKLTYTWTLEGE